MLGRVDLRHSGMMAFEMERRRRDDPVDVGERREAGCLLRRTRRRIRGLPHGAYERRAIAVRTDRRAKETWRLRRRLGFASRQRAAAERQQSKECTPRRADDRRRWPMHQVVDGGKPAYKNSVFSVCGPFSVQTAYVDRVIELPDCDDSYIVTPAYSPLAFST